MITIALLLATSLQLPPIGPFAAELRQSVASGNQMRVAALFSRKADSDYVFRMSSERGGLRSMQVAMIPSPPGWEATGRYWAIIHTRQDIEDYHDPVFPVIPSGNDWKLGPEIPEDATTGVQIKNAAIDAKLTPANHRIDVAARLDLTLSAQRRAPLFRLNDIYKVSGAVVDAKGSQAGIIEVGDSIPEPKSGDVVHAGSLLVPWSPKVAPRISFTYSGTVDSPNEDKIGENVAYVTAWWVPSLGRLPHTTSVRVTCPNDWVVESEGKRIDPEDSELGSIGPHGDLQVRDFRCDIPISFPKIVGGKYIVAAEKMAGNRTFRAYHLDSGSNDRAQKDVQTIADAIAWYDSHLGTFPFSEYNCFDADTYYGIESYNYTLLNTRITSWAVAHEIGHTYFGGLVPCAYVHDSWNESMTQYVDSVLRQNNADRTLEGAASSLNLAVPLTEMPVAHEYNSATYYRGAFALKMLEHEIGLDNMFKAIRAMIADRRGKDTTWYDLRPYFEKAAGRRLDWFWTQWISGAVFPKLDILDAQGIPSASGTKVFVTVRQSGPPNPFRLRLRVYAKGLNKEVSKEFEMHSPQAVFELNLGPEKAYRAGIDVLGYVLAPKVPEAIVKQ